MRSVSPRLIGVVFAVLLGMIFLVVTGPVAGQSQPTVVEEDVTQNTIWTAEEGPYRVVANVTVQPNTSLSIESGTVIQVAEGVSLRVRGDLLADGTTGAPVVFTASKANPAPGAWRTILVNGTEGSTVEFSNVRLEYARTGITVTNQTEHVSLTGATVSNIEMDGIRYRNLSKKSGLTVRNSEFSAIGGRAIAAVSSNSEPPLTGVSGWRIADSDFSNINDETVFIEGDRVRNLFVLRNRFAGEGTPALRVETEMLSGTRIRENTVKVPGDGMSITADRVWQVSLTDNAVVGAQTGIALSASEAVRYLHIENNRVTNSRTGIQLVHRFYGDRQFPLDVTITNNTLTGNDRQGLHVRTGASAQGELAITGNTLSGNNGAGANLATRFLENSTIARNQFVSNDDAGLSIATRRMNSSHIKNNLARSNGDHGIAVVAERALSNLTVSDNRALDNAGVGVRMRNDEADNGEIRFRENLLAANAYGLRVSGPQSARIMENTVVFNTYGFGEPSTLADYEPGTGVILERGQDNYTIERNDIYGHEVGLVTATQGTVEAEQNYWGEPSGPYHRSIHTEGNGNPILTRSGWIDVFPVASDPTGRTYHRPKPRLSVVPKTGTTEDSFELSGTNSSDSDGHVREYRFSVEGHSATTSEDETRSVTFESPGTYRATLQVADDLGIESNTKDHLTISVEEQVTTTTTSTPGNRPTTTAQDRGPIASLGTIGGVLGLILYLLAAGLGFVGMYQTVADKPTSVRGRRIQAIALAGIAVWAVFGLFGTKALLTISGIGLVIWGTLTGLSYAIVRRSQ